MTSSRASRNIDEEAVRHFSAPALHVPEVVEEVKVEAPSSEGRMEDGEGLAHVPPSPSSSTKVRKNTTMDEVYVELS